MDDPPARKGPDPHDKQVGGTHYKDLELQPWDVMKSWFTNDEYRGFLRGNALKYIARYRNKGGVQDLEKSVHYLEALIAYEQETAERPA